jgi:predicted Zn-dependent protease
MTETGDRSQYSLQKRAGFWKHLLVTASAVFAYGCASTGGPLGLSREQEKAIGEQQHPQIVAQFGGEVQDVQMRSYVDGIAKKLIAASDHPNDPIVITTLDSPVVNAFALPGHVYVTRGLLALANSEAELAGVLGHELGHVYSRHTAERVSRSNVTGIGAAIVGILTGSQEGMQLAGQLGQLYLLKYSRGQEYEADLIGVRLLGSSNYDPAAQADFLNTLGRWSNLEAQLSGASSPPEFLSTHPNSAERVRRAAQEAQVVAAPGAIANRNRALYLSRIDGMLYGDDPIRQGFVRGNEFIHPQMKFAFSVPSSFALANTPTAVVGRSQNGGQMQFLSGNTDQTPAAFIEGAISQSLGIDLKPARSVTINGRPAAVGSARGNTQSGQVDVQVQVIQWNGQEHFIFMWVTPVNVTAQLQSAINSSVSSLRAIDPASVNAPAPLTVDIVRVKSGDTVSSLAGKSGFANAKQERFIVINGLLNANDLNAGDDVKIIR